MVFDKPAGLLVIPTPQKEKNTLVDIVNSWYSAKEKGAYLHPCHRIDRDTSGIILFAKGKHHQQLMMDEFKKRHVKKKYIAFLNGRLLRRQAEIRSAVKDFDQQRYSQNLPPKLAITRYHVVEIRKAFTIAEVYPVTGRTNQIRIQFSQIGYPLLGDRKYAIGKDFLVKFRRVALHAQELQWRHPILNKTVKVIAPLPKDMEEFLVRNQD